MIEPHPRPKESESENTIQIKYLSADSVLSFKETITESMDELLERINKLEREELAVKYTMTVGKMGS